MGCNLFTPKSLKLIFLANGYISLLSGSESRVFPLSTIFSVYSHCLPVYNVFKKVRIIIYMVDIPSVKGLITYVPFICKYHTICDFLMWIFSCWSVSQIVIAALLFVLTFFLYGKWAVNIVLFNKVCFFCNRCLGKWRLWIDRNMLISLG